MRIIDRARTGLRGVARWGLRRNATRPVTAAALAVHALLGAVERAPGRVTEVAVVEHTAIAQRSGTLAPAIATTCTAPRSWDDTEPRSFHLPGRPLAWSVLNDVELNDTSMVKVGRTLVGATGVLEDVRRGLQFKGPDLAGHHDRRALVSTAGPTERVERGIRLCGFGSGNWYHWLIDILPSALLIDELPHDLRDAPLLVPQAAGRSAAWRAALEVVAPERETITVPRRGTLAVDRMVWLDPAVNGPRTLRDDAPIALDLLAPSFAVLARFRATVLERLAVGPSARPGRRVLLVRPAGAKRSVNQDDLVAVAQRRGFEAVDPGSLPFVEQVRLFAEAEVIAGGWGAAWSSMLFAAPGARGLMWTPSAFARWPLFSNLAEVSGVHLRHLFVAVGSTALVPANKAPQHVPPDAFATALDAIL